MDNKNIKQEIRKLLEKKLSSYLRYLQARMTIMDKPVETEELLTLPKKRILNLMTEAFIMGAESVKEQENMNFDNEENPFDGDLYDDEPQNTNLLTEARKKEDLYYQGAFWIKGDSVDDIKCGRFTLIGAKFQCDVSGKYTVDLARSKSSLTHRRLWCEYAGELADKPYNYLPRGRVGVYNGKAYINMNSLFNTPDIIDAIIEMYHIGKLEIQLSFNDTYQGSHYDFLLK